MSISHDRPEEAGRQGPVRAPQSLAGGLFLVALAALALWLSRDLSRGTLSAMGPGMLPDWLAIGVGLCGLALLVFAFLRTGEALERWSLRGPVLVVAAILAFAVTIRPFSIGALASPGLGLVAAGPLAEGVRMEPGTELFGADVDAAEVRAMLDRFPGSERGRVVAEARATR